MASIQDAIQALYRRKREIETHALHERVDGRNNELSVYDNHPADSSDIYFEASKDRVLEEFRHQEYDQVMRAIEKVEKGTYGICEVTGQQIPIERLLASPIALTIIEKANDTRHVEPAMHAPPSEALTFDSATDLWEELLNTTEDEGYRETATDDGWVEDAPGFTEEYERYASTGIEGYTGAEHVHIVSSHHRHLERDNEWR
ncbi:TraR/DksA C4-type zinc finger protein [Geomicrobium sp. JCM 19039]|uniref:TraR/DksA C4-type zinc finger protein n=2 Tax=unclassified Geomicrobium TaxID=2628951 RepID=UPI00045F46DB|nr:TraR/DksA C4-type zinc finger protein [Geomicrobium sp. JCM 19039]GAK10842.1 DnaK suppressor protein [Geomicrobium sp. JCM 19039]